MSSDVKIGLREELESETSLCSNFTFLQSAPVYNICMYVIPHVLIIAYVLKRKTVSMGLLLVAHSIHAIRLWYILRNMTEISAVVN